MNDPQCSIICNIGKGIRETRAVLFWYKKVFGNKTRSLVRIDGMENRMKKNFKTIIVFLIIATVLLLMSCGLADNETKNVSENTTAYGGYSWEEDMDGLTEPVDNSTGLEDGIYHPDDFGWSGGTGRVSLSCDEVEVKNGAAWAVISLDSSYYDYVRANGKIYYGPKANEKSIFRFPVALNHNNRILALTTKMSSAHEIEYIIYIYLEAADVESTGSQAGTLEYSAGKNGDFKEENTAADILSDLESERNETADIDGLTLTKKVSLSYAEQFDIYEYEQGYTLIDIHNSAKYLIIPEDGHIPESLDDNVVILQRPIDNIYLAATSAMSLFDAMDALSRIRFSGTAMSGWYVENAAKAMENEQILFAGKYSEPDYELLVSGGCRLAVESTMILHAPKVKEMLENLGIPVFIDYSSYESHPLGRTEWIKVYGALTGKMEEAETFFEQQAVIMKEQAEYEKTNKKVAFFYINTKGTAVVRRTDDYIPRMIVMGGGVYAFDKTADIPDSGTSVEMSMEQFYADALDADYIIYNTAIDTSVKNLEDLMAKNRLFADFKAVKEGNVWCCGGDMYQATDRVSHLIRDVHLMLSDGDEKDMVFLKKLMKQK